MGYMKKCKLPLLHYFLPAQNTRRKLGAEKYTISLPEEYKKQLLLALIRCEVAQIH